MADIRAAYPDPDNPLPGDMEWDLLGAHLDTEESRQRLRRNIPTGAEARLIIKPFTALDEGTFLHEISEIETYKLLIDCLRLRQEDERDFTGNAMANTIHDGKSASSNLAMIHLLAEGERANVLPPWWTGLNVFECIRFAKMNGEFSLTAARTE